MGLEMEISIGLEMCVGLEMSMGLQISMRLEMSMGLEISIGIDPPYFFKIFCIMENLTSNHDTGEGQPVFFSYLFSIKFSFYNFLRLLKNLS